MGTIASKHGEAELVALLCLGSVEYPLNLAAIATVMQGSVRNQVLICYTDTALLVSPIRESQPFLIRHLMQVVI